MTTRLMMLPLIASIVGGAACRGQTPAPPAATPRVELPAGFDVPTKIIPPYVSVSGGILYPRRVDWEPGMTVLSAIATCGGLSDFSNGKIRMVRHEKLFGEFNFGDLRSGKVPDLKLEPKDQVIVQE